MTGNTCSKGRNNLRYIIAEYTEWLPVCFVRTANSMIKLISGLQSVNDVYHCFGSALSESFPSSLESLAFDTRIC